MTFSTPEPITRPYLSAHGIQPITVWKAVSQFRGLYLLLIRLKLSYVYLCSARWIRLTRSALKYWRNHFQSGDNKNRCTAKKCRVKDCDFYGTKEELVHHLSEHTFKCKYCNEEILRGEYVYNPNYTKREGKHIGEYSNYRRHTKRCAYQKNGPKKHQCDICGVVVTNLKVHRLGVYLKPYLNKVRKIKNAFLERHLSCYLYLNANISMPIF